MTLDKADVVLSHNFSIVTAGPNGKPVGIGYNSRLSPDGRWNAYEQQGHGITMGGRGATLLEAIEDLARIKVNMPKGDEVLQTAKNLAETAQVRAVVTLVGQSSSAPAVDEPA